MLIGAEIGSCSVAEVMGTEMFTLTPETAVSSAQQLVRENNIHHMLVLENGTLAGIVCRDDLRFADHDSVVGDYMTSPVLCITPETTLQEAIDIMSANNVDCLPVVTGAYLVGIVTRDALATADLVPAAGHDDDADASDEPCVACTSTDDVADDERTGELALCARCRAFIVPNQQC
jgi:CBS domain-containing protein